MIQLATTTEKLRLVTSAGVTVDVLASFSDLNSGTVTPDSTPILITTATTTDILAAPAASTVRRLLHLNVRNRHASSSNTVTVQWHDTSGGTTTVELMKVLLLAGETLVYNGTWFVTDPLGGIKGAFGYSPINPSTNDFRLSGVSATPVMTADSTSLSTIYLAQFIGNRIALYDGTNWQLYMPASEPSLAVSGRTTDRPFDIYAYANAGVVTLEFLDWTNATTRATGLTRVDGVWTKNGDATRRYLGTCRARSATTFHHVTLGIDLPVKLDLWNVDNRVETAFTQLSVINTWNYTTATWRQAQASANYQVEIMVGLQEDNFAVHLTVSSRNSTISIPRQVGIGYDSTTGMSGIAGATANTVASIECSQTAHFVNQPSIGTHFYAWLEISTATGTCTWIGDDGAARLQSGMTGLWKC